MHVFERMTVGDHEQVVFCRLTEARLMAIIAIHDTTLGPALGGTRMWAYASEEAALHDVLGLSRDMTFKAAAAGLKLGGGKAVILGDPATDKTDELFRAYGRFIDTLGGRFIAAEDAGTDVADIEQARSQTDHVVGTDPARGGSGDPSPMTAWGVFCGIEAALAHVYGTPVFAGRRIAVQGAGKVGAELVRRLVRAGAEVVVADRNHDRARRLAQECKATQEDPARIHAVACDVFAPCALSGVINAKSVDALACRIIAGGANNQIADPAFAGDLHRRGILYVPDFVINAGGLISVASERESFDRAHVEREVVNIGKRVADLLGRAAREDRMPLAVADAMVRDVLAAARDAGHLPHLCPRRR